jgi:hypothetical protein
MDIATLRTELYKAIDAVLNRYMMVNEFSITLVETEQGYIYHWPKETEVFDLAHWYEVAGGNGKMRILVARKNTTDRPVWSKFRGHIAIFAQSESSKTLYPCAEFIETDDGDYAAIIPNPENPRSALKDGEQLPERFSNARVLRNDQVFRSIRNGPVLRLIVKSTDEEAMVKHGYWVAQLRRRI